jgi:magnesium-transporting ATPase (P-type)
LNELAGMISGEDFGDLMIIYGTGATSVFIMLMLMYRYALQHADELDLNDIERYDTRASMRANLLMASIPLLSTLIAIVLRNFTYVGMFSGFIYFLYTPVMLIHGRNVSKGRKKILEKMRSEQKD